MINFNTAKGANDTTSSHSLRTEILSFKIILLISDYEDLTKDSQSR